MKQIRRPMISRAIRPAIEAIEKRCLLSGVPAGPIVMIDGFDGPQYDSQPLVVTWEATDPIGVSSANVTVQRANEDPFFTSPLASGTTNLGHLVPGNYVIIVNSTNAVGTSSSYSRAVNVLDDDTDGPAIRLTGFDGGQNAADTQDASWTITDASGVAGITVELQRFTAGTWQTIHQYDGSAASGSFNFDTYGPGRYSISITATDTDNDRTGDAASSSFSQIIDVVGDAVADGLTIRVTGAEPIQTDDQTQQIAWIATGPAAVQSVALRVDSVTTPHFVDASYVGGVGSFNFDHFKPGDYTFFLTATDAAGATTTFVRTIQISDDDNAPPVISVGGLASPQSSSAVNEFTWNITDPSGLSDVRVTIYRNSTEIHSYTGTQGSGSFNFDNRGTGTYGIEIFAFDNDGDRTGETRGTNIYREALVLPASGTAVITLGGSSGAETDGQSQHFTWAGGTITAVNFLAYTPSGFTLSPLSIAAGNHDFNGLGVGTFYLSVTATDSGVQTVATRQVVVTDDDTTGPEITLGGSIGEEPVSATQFFNWAIGDDSGVSSAAITITRFHNGASTTLLTSSASSGSYNFDSQGPGVYMLTVKATDNDSDAGADTASSFAMREVLIVAGNTPPAIVISDAPAVQLDGENQFIEWSMSDANGIASAFVTLTRYTGGSSDIVATTTSPAGSFDFNAHGVGTFILSATATDASGVAITVTRTIVVLDDDTLPPTILITGSAGLDDDGQTQEFAWDVSGIVSVVITRNTGSGAQDVYTSTTPIGAFNFDHLGLGAYLITITATDADADWASDASTVVMTRSVTVIDDDNSPPQIILGGSIGTESHGLNNQFTWEVTGGSAIVTISDDGGTIHTTTAADGTFSLDSLGLGAFSISVAAADDDNDWIGDTLANVTATRQVMVINHAPAFTAAQPVQPAYEGSQTAFTASATDADGETLVYTWDFGDGATTTGDSPSHAYANSGSYSVSLTIADAYGFISQTMTMNVANVAPAAGIMGLPVSASEGGLISLTATATDVSPADTSAGFTYSWSVTRNSFSYASGSGAAIEFTPDDNGTYDITVFAADQDGGTGTFSETIEVVNVTPTASLAGAPNAGEEGSVIEISPIITDPGQADMAADFIYAWTIAKNGSPYASSPAAVMSFTPADNGEYVVSLVVTDKDGGVSLAAEHTILVSNVAPTVTIAAPAAGVRYQSLPFSAVFSDPGLVDTHTVTWNFGDGTILSARDVSETGAMSPAHEYAANGQYTVSVTITDKDGGMATASSTLAIQSVLHSDGMTYIGGTSSTNIVAITSLGIVMDGVWLGSIGNASRIVVFAGPGHDIVAVSDSVSTPLELYGGPGNDTLKGGSGADILVGGDGNDLLSGSYGRDLIIGGDGADILIGNADDDILVAGATAHDANATALRAIIAEWSSGRNYATRVANIRGVGSGPRNNGGFFFRTDGELANVFDDGVRDLLMGNAGTDWFIFNKTIGVTDWALDVHSGEFTQDEVMLLSDGTSVIV